MIGSVMQPVPCGRGLPNTPIEGVGVATILSFTAFPGASLMPGTKWPRLLRGMRALVRTPDKRLRTVLGVGASAGHLQTPVNRGQHCRERAATSLISSTVRLPDCRVTRLCPLIGFCVSFPTPYHLNTGWSKLGNLSPRGQGQNAASFPVPAGSTMHGSAWHPEDRNQPGVVKVDSTRPTCRTTPCMNRKRC